MHDQLRIGTDELTFRITSEQTAGALLAVEVRLPAGGGPPTLHRHAPLEVYRVDRGELAIYVEDAAGEVERIATSRAMTRSPTSSSPPGPRWSATGSR